jgi:hypothetical protein
MKERLIQTFEPANLIPSILRSTVSLSGNSRLSGETTLAVSNGLMAETL